MHASPRGISSTRRLAVIAAALTTALVLGACGDDEDAGEAAAAAAPDPSSSVGASSSALEGTVNLGFFPNVTHAPALVGIGDGLIQAQLGDGVELNTFTFNAGTDAIEAFFAGAIDITLIGPNPAINGFAQSNGEALRIVSGSTSGGAYLVVGPGITSADQLAGTKIASPSLGNTQDVALRAWLADQGYATTPEGGGDVTILPQSNATTLESFVSGQIDGAWVPEPWATRLILEGGGHVLVDERDLWPETNGEYVTTHAIVRTEYLAEHPELVKAVIAGLADAIDAIEADPATAQATVIDQIEQIAAQRPSEAVVAKSFENLTFTLDPIAASLQKSADDAIAVGLLDPVELTGIYDLTLLNEVLEARGSPAIEAP
ncbi:MAG TPA: ABC transporter substrate-binding protein [Ilumatobacter sp.]|nr:ABC transporter substrate-binding protein [Ilumatobacter sp.]